MMNGELEKWRGFLKNPRFIFTHSPFSPIHLFFNFPKLLNSYFLSFPSRSALIRVYLRQKNPFLFSIFSFPQLSSSFLFQTAKLLQEFLCQRILVLAVFSEGALGKPWAPSPSPAKRVRVRVKGEASLCANFRGILSFRTNVRNLALS